MNDKKPLTEEEARQLIRRLEEHYGEPAWPLSKVCNAVFTWMDCIEKNNTDPQLARGSYGQGVKYYKHFRQMKVDIMKSNLLGRLLYAKEALRTERCPRHKGHWSGQAMFFEKCPHNCDGTGWLRARPEDGGYTGGISIREGKEIDGELYVKDRETGEWTKFDEEEEE